MTVFTLLVKISHARLESLAFGIEATNINPVSGNIVVTHMKGFKHETLWILLG